MGEPWQVHKEPLVLLHVHDCGVVQQTSHLGVAHHLRSTVKYLWVGEHVRKAGRSSSALETGHQVLNGGVVHQPREIRHTSWRSSWCYSWSTTVGVTVSASTVSVGVTAFSPAALGILLQVLLLGDLQRLNDSLVLWVKLLRSLVGVNCVVVLAQGEEGEAAEKSGQSGASITE